jgi:hypothetical protein
MAGLNIASPSAFASASADKCRRRLNIADRCPNKPDVQNKRLKHLFKTVVRQKRAGVFWRFRKFLKNFISLSRMHLSSFALCSFHDFSSISCRFAPYTEEPCGSLRGGIPNRFIIFNFQFSICGSRVCEAGVAHPWDLRYAPRRGLWLLFKSKFQTGLTVF